MPVSYTLLLHPRFQSLLDDGTPNAGGKVYTYQAGTTTLATTYSDPGLTAANANPVVLDASGQADIWCSGPYKLVVQDVNGVQLYSADNLFGFKSDLFCSLPVQDQDKLWAWDSVLGKVKNSNLTLTAIEIAVNAFNVALLTNGAVVVADVGDTSPGTLTDKLLVSGALTKAITTDGSGNKRLSLSVDDPVGSDLYLYENCNGL